MDILDTLNIFFEHNLRIKNNQPYTLFINGSEYFIHYNIIYNKCNGLNYIIKDKFNISKIKTFDNYIFERVYKNGFIYKKDNSIDSRAKLLNDLFNLNKVNNIFEQSDVSKTTYNPYYRKGILLSLFSSSNTTSNPMQQCIFNNDNDDWDTSLVDTNESSTQIYKKQVGQGTRARYPPYKAPIECPPYIYRGEGLKQRDEDNIPSIGQQGRIISFSYIDISLVNNKPIRNYIYNYGKFFIIYDNYNDSKQLDNNILGSFIRDAWTDHRDILLIDNKIIPGAGLYNLDMVSLYAQEEEAGQWCQWLIDNSNNKQYTSKQQQQIKDIFKSVKDQCTPDVINNYACECCQLPGSKCDKVFYTDLSAGLNALYTTNKKYKCKNNDCFNEILIKSWTYNKDGLSPSADNLKHAKELINDTSLASNLGWKDTTIKTSTTNRLPILAYGVLNYGPYDPDNDDIQSNVTQLELITNNTQIPIVYLDTKNNKFEDIPRKDITYPFKELNCYDGHGATCLNKKFDSGSDCDTNYKNNLEQCKSKCNTSIKCQGFTWGNKGGTSDPFYCQFRGDINFNKCVPGNSYGYNYKTYYKSS